MVRLTTQPQTKMKPADSKENDEDDDDDSLHFEDCINLFPSSKQCEAKKLKNETSMPPDAIECSFANSSSSTSCQGSSSYLDINDTEQDQQHEDETVAKEKEEEEENNEATTCDNDTFDNNGHCNWANVSTNRLVQANYSDDDDGPVTHHPIFKMKKSVRFATNTNDGSIQCTVHLIDTRILMTAEDNDDDNNNDEDSRSSCWWNKTDAMRIHAECYAVATHYKKNCPDYLDAIAGLAFSFSSSSNTDDSMTELEILQYQNIIEKSSSARGLEGNICRDLLKNVLYKTHQGLVLLTQYEHRQSSTRGGGSDDNKDDIDNNNNNNTTNNQHPSSFPFTDDGLEAIRDASLRTSLPSRQLAFKLAEYDVKEAIQAMHMPWNNTTTTTTTNDDNDDGKSA